MNDDGKLSDLKVFAYQGGESLAQDIAGNLYLAAGQIYVYNRKAQLTNVIKVPERPTHLVFGGADHRTLFILSHTSLYSLHVESPGQ